jgi:hypothetical protein
MVLQLLAPRRNTSNRRTTPSAVAASARPLPPSSSRHAAPTLRSARSLTTDSVSLSPNTCIPNRAHISVRRTTAVRRSRRSLDHLSRHQRHPRTTYDKRGRRVGSAVCAPLSRTAPSRRPRGGPRPRYSPPADPLEELQLWAARAWRQLGWARRAWPGGRRWGVRVLRTGRTWRAEGHWRRHALEAPCR